MRFRTITEGKTDYLKAFVPPPGSPPDSTDGVELGRIAKRIIEEDKAIFERWKDVMSSALALICLDIEGIEKVTLVTRKPGEPL